MMLEEAVALLPGDVTIAIGSASCFFFIGSRDDYFWYVDMIEDDIVNANCIKRLSNAMKNLAARVADMRLMHKSKVNMYHVAYIHRKIEQAFNSSVNSAQFAGAYLRLRTREVRELWYNDYDNRFQILVEGDENGEYWLEAEFLEDYGKNGKKLEASAKETREYKPVTFRRGYRSYPKGENNHE